MGDREPPRGEMKMKYLKKALALLIFYTVLTFFHYDPSEDTDYFVYYFTNLIVSIFVGGMLLLSIRLWFSEEE